MTDDYEEPIFRTSRIKPEPDAGISIMIFGDDSIVSGTIQPEGLHALFDNLFGED